MILAEDVIPAAKKERLLDAIETVIDMAVYEIEDARELCGGRESKNYREERARVLAELSEDVLAAVLETEALVVAR